MLTYSPTRGGASEFIGFAECWWMKNLPLLRAFVKLKLFLLTLISSACLGEDCSSGTSIVESPNNASILQGWSHTFRCKGTGSSINWEINGEDYSKLPQNSNLQVVSTDTTATGNCTQQSRLTVHAVTPTGDKTLLTYAIECVAKKTLYSNVVSEVVLKVHVIGGAGDVELISPASLSGTPLIQWNAAEEIYGDGSPLYYNITVRDPSEQIISQSTTTDTSFAIDSDLLVPCHSYEVTLLPFQPRPTLITELGIMTQTVKNYSGILVPATEVMSSVSLEPDAANVTVAFKVNLTGPSFQWPTNYTVIVMQQGTNATEAFQSAKQPVVGMENEYTLENLDLRQKYRVSIKVENNCLSNTSEVINVSTFRVQGLKLNFVNSTYRLNIVCVNALGANESCKIEVLNETEKRICGLNASSEEEASCALPQHPAVVILVKAYDEGYLDAPAVTEMFITPPLDSYFPTVTPALDSDSPTVVPESEDPSHSTTTETRETLAFVVELIETTGSTLNVAGPATFTIVVIVLTISALVTMVVVETVTTFLLIVKRRRKKIFKPDPSKMDKLEMSGFETSNTLYYTMR